RKWRTLIIVCVAIFMLLLDITIVNVALPRIQRDLHTSFTDLQWVVDAYSLMLATVMLTAGSLGDLLGPKRVFLSGVALLPIGVALVFFGWRALHESSDEAHGGIDVPGLLTLSGGLFALVLALLRGNDWGWSSGRVVGLFAGAVVLIVAFTVIELRQENPMFDPRVFRVPAFAGAQIH